MTATPRNPLAYRNLYEKFFPYRILRDTARCIRCRVCEHQCTYGAIAYREDLGAFRDIPTRCVACLRCQALCPTGAIAIDRSAEGRMFRGHQNWHARFIQDIRQQAEEGGVLLGAMGANAPGGYRSYFDHMLIDACQVTNPSIDPIREPMELRVALGRKPDAVRVRTSGGNGNGAGGVELATRLAPQLVAEYPVLFGPMSYGSINLTIHRAMARAAADLGTYYNTGEGGLHRSLYRYGHRTIVQCASGRFGVSRAYLAAGAAVEIKIGQGAKPGIGGHLPGEKVDEDISATRMIPAGTDAISPAPHHDIYSIEDLRQLIYALKETTAYRKPVIVKIAAVHQAPAIASGIARAGADVIVLDGMRGGTGAAPAAVRDHVGIPIEVALAAVDERLRSEGIRNRVSIIAAGGIRCSGDVVKAIALGADAVYIATAALIAVGCTLCAQCHRGICAWGIATNRPDLAKRVHPDEAYEQLTNLVRAWGHEIKEMLGLMGINAIESLRGNRAKLRGFNLTEAEHRVLGIKQAGEL